MVTRKEALKIGGAAALASAAAPLLLENSAAAQGTIVLDFWNWWGGTRKPLINQLIRRFEAKYPNIRVNSVLKTYDHRSEQILTALISPNPPAVIMALRPEITSFASQGTIVPITPYVRANHVDLNKFYPSELASMWWRGQLYSMPMPSGLEYGMYIYNTDLFRKAGLNPAKPPATWKDYLAASAAMTKRDAKGKILQMGADVLYEGVGATFISYLYCNNGTLYSPDTKRITINTPEGLATLQFLLDHVNKQYGGILNYNDFFTGLAGEDDSDPRFPWYQGRMGMFLVGFWTFYLTQTLAPHLRYDVALQPYNGDNPKAKSQGVVEDGWGYVIPKGLSPEQEKAAYLFVQFLTYDTQGGCQFMQQQGRPSPLRACNESPVYFKINPVWGKVRQVLAREVSEPILPVTSQIVSLIDSNLSQAFYGKMSAPAALKAASSAAQAVLDKYWSSTH